MSSTFGIVAPDAEVTVTLAFDGGRCTIYDGLRDEPDLVITADSGKIPEMSLLSIRYGMPWLLDENGKNFVRALLKREIRIDGLIRIPPTPLWAMKHGEGGARPGAPDPHPLGQLLRTQKAAGRSAGKPEELNFLIP